MKIKELLSSEEKWTQGASARTAQGHQVLVTDDRASCFCLLGAISKCYRNVNDYNSAVAKLASKLGRFWSVIDWNDAPERTFKEVKALVEELDI